MRLPWIQLAADGVRRARMAGVLMGIGEHAGVGFVAAVWQCALELAPDGDFSGTVSDPEVLVSGAGGIPPGCPADAGGVVSILQRVGLVSTAPMLRVRGLDRYRSAWLKNRKRHGHPPGFPPEPEANPERKTETKTEKNTLPAPRKKRADAEAPDPRHQPLVAKLDEVFKAKRGTGYPWDGRAAKTVKNLLKRRPNHGDALWPMDLAAAWARALDAKFPECKSLADFERDLPRYIGTGQVGAAPTRVVKPGEDLYANG